MGSKTNRKSKSTKTRSSTSKKNIRVRQAAKKMNEKFSKDRSEHVRDALNRDVNLLYSVRDFRFKVTWSDARHD